MVIEDRLALDDRWQNLLPNKDLQPLTDAHRSRSSRLARKG